MALDSQDKDATGAEGEGESPGPDINLPLSLSHQVIQDVNFGGQQKQDEHLKHCWSQMHKVEGKLTATPLPIAYFVRVSCVIF